MNRSLTIDEEIFLNQFVQSIHDLKKMNTWFESHDLANKRDIMNNLHNMVIQSHPTYDDFESSAISLKKITSVSAVKLLNRKKSFSKFGYEICALPENELLNGFDIFLLTLSKADNRRKSKENINECHQWWHKDLSNENYLRMLRMSKHP